MEIKVTRFPRGNNGKTMAGWRRSDGGERGRNKLPAEESLLVYLGRKSPSYSNIVRAKTPSANPGRDETTRTHSFPSHTRKHCVVMAAQHTVLVQGVLSKPAEAPSVVF